MRRSPCWQWRSGRKELLVKRFGVGDMLCPAPGLGIKRVCSVISGKIVLMRSNSECRHNEAVGNLLNSKTLKLLCIASQ
jgi:hypothetical protein